ncbi:unnamed protein product, partial [Iphiclides podalirius]
MHQHNAAVFTVLAISIALASEVTAQGAPRSEAELTFAETLYVRLSGASSLCYIDGLTVRANDIEVTENLTADAKIIAVRPGMHTVIISDNTNTNLKGADAELKCSIAELNTGTVREAAAELGVEVRFIPPGAPEMGEGHGREWYVR